MFKKRKSKKIQSRANVIEAFGSDDDAEVVKIVAKRNRDEVESEIHNVSDSGKVTSKEDNSITHSVSDNSISERKTKNSPKLSNTAKYEATKEDRMQAEVNQKIEEKVKEIIEKKSQPIDLNGSYKGADNYATFTKRQIKLPKGLNKNAANIKATTVVDLQPDICKDFKQHGYCGYGDTCKFLHVRESLKKTTVEKEWEIKSRKKRKTEDKLLA